MRFKKSLAIISSCLLLSTACLTGCGTPSSFEPDETLIPTYEKTDEFRFVAYMSPPPANSGSGSWANNPNYMTLEHYQNMADCGFNYATGIYENTKAQYIAGMDLAAQVGMKYYVRDYSFPDGSIEGIIAATENKRDAEDLLAQYEDNIKARFDEYMTHEGFGGILAIDEPSTRKYESIAVMNEWYHKNYPTTEFQVNLLPTYATQAQLYGTNASNGKYAKDYAQSFNDIVNPQVLSYDHYALSKSGTVNKISTSYLRNLEIFAELSKSTGKPYYVFLLTLGHWDYRQPEYYRDIAWQVYTALAYGAKGAQTFTYWTNLVDDEAVGTALIDKNGNKMPSYYAMQEVTSEIRAMEQVYMNFNWQGTLPIVSNKYEGNDMYDYLDNALTQHSRISSLSADQDAIVGAFKDKDGNDGFMLSNVTDPADNLTSNVTIGFNDADAVVVYKKGRTLIYGLKNGKTTISLGSGEGAFIIPVKK